MVEEKLDWAPQIWWRKNWIGHPKFGGGKIGLGTPNLVEEKLDWAPQI